MEKMKIPGVNNGRDKRKMAFVLSNLNGLQEGYQIVISIEMCFSMKLVGNQQKKKKKNLNGLHP
jgi:hypothetical protein